jgi:hypothetical protein
MSQRFSSSRDQELSQAREFDEASTVLIKIGTGFVRRNPIKVSLYLMGVIICLIFSGWKVSMEQRQEFEEEIQKVDFELTTRLSIETDYAYNQYYRSKGWFTCNDRCQEHWKNYQSLKKEFENVKKEEAKQTAYAKSKLGIFSEYGVDETKQLFWKKFVAGKEFAKRQSTFDMIFLAIGAIGRDESFLEYILRVLITVLMNFTIGVFAAVVSFIFSLGSLIYSYQASFFTGLSFFMLASLAAISFALSWIVGFYCLAAGVTFVGFTVAKGSLLLGAGPNRRQERIY